VRNLVLFWHHSNWAARVWKCSNISEHWNKLVERRWS